MSEVTIARNRTLAAIAAGVSALVAAAYFVRAVGGGSGLDWLALIVLVALTVVHLRAVHDARTPLLVADTHGVRIRLAASWIGMPWSEIEEVEHLPRRGLLRDGRVVLFPRDPEALIDGLGRASQASVWISRRLHRAPFALPLGLTTRVTGVEAGLTAALADLAGERCEIVEIVPDLAVDPVVDREDVAEDVAEDRASDDTAAIDAAAIDAAATDTAPDVRITAPMAMQEESPTATVVVADLADLPLVDPVIGPVLRGARERLRLSIDQVADRTKIRPHVLEALEIDDFGPCGGDFYARGHLRTLGRVLGVDVAPLLAVYDERYADAPVDPLRVFEAGINGHRARETQRSRPGGSVLVAAVMATVLVWSVARLLMATPVTVAPVTPSLANGSAGLSRGADLAPPVPVIVTATGGGAHVVVRDGGGAVIFKDSIPFGVTRSLRVSPPVRIQTSDGSLEVTVDGVGHGAMGETGRSAQDVFTAR